MKLLTGRLAILTAAMLTLCAPQFRASDAAANDAGTTQESAPPSTMKTVIIGVLFTASLISVFLIAERGITLRQSKVIPRRLPESQTVCRTKDDLLALRTACNHEPSPYGRLLSCCIDNLHLSRDENMAILQTRARAEVVKMEHGIVVLEIITGVAPLLGLVGTIFGLITLFKGMGVEATSEQTAMFSEGISIALQATLLGLIVAIPSLVGWSYFNRKIETMVVEMENLCDEFLRSQYQRAGSNE
jgi:biopolymer transport protein ExbB|tara:strand:- start:384 stop:1118 length:735 start_codon:yes stop_codon:yes gene_type:complete